MESKQEEKRGLTLAALVAQSPIREIDDRALACDYDCVICQTTIYFGDDCDCRWCGKIFHTDCFQRWERTCNNNNIHLNCPLCKGEVSLVTTVVSTPLDHLDEFDESFSSMYFTQSPPAPPLPPVQLPEPTPIPEPIPNNAPNLNDGKKKLKIRSVQKITFDFEIDNNIPIYKLRYELVDGDLVVKHNNHILKTVTLSDFSLRFNKVK